MWSSWCGREVLITWPCLRRILVSQGAHARSEDSHLRHVQCHSSLPDGAVDSLPLDYQSGREKATIGVGQWPAIDAWEVVVGAWVYPSCRMRRVPCWKIQTL